MNAKFEAPADLRALRALVERSPIRSLPAQGPEAIFADWERDRKSTDVDALILAWIASHVQRPAHRGRLH
ncbi:MAG TPA: hypothetical protein VIY51_08320 [Xanthobacteraceae bacterium]